MQYLNPKGVMVIIEAEHMCMTMRGIKKPGTQIITMAYKGEFETNKELRDLLINVVHL
jgi:GTP cyclohydrolase I